MKAKYKIQEFLFEEALKAFKASDGASRLLDQYKEIPSGTCSSCGACCFDNVPLSAGEFLMIVSTLEDQGHLHDAIDRVANWYINQFNQVQPCVFLGEDRRCQIYAVRPLVCRLFGHQSPQEQARRVGIVLEQNRKLAEAVKDAYGIIIKPEVVGHAIKQCDFVPNAVYDKERQDLSFQRVQELDLPLYRAGLLEEDYINLSLVEWFVLAYLDEDVLLEQTIANQ